MEYELRQLEKLKNQTQQAIQINETEFNQKLETELNRLKDRKPEFFTITAEEQLAKLTAHLASSFIRWLIE